MLLGKYHYTMSVIRCAVRKRNFILNFEAYIYKVSWSKVYLLLETLKDIE